MLNKNYILSKTLISSYSKLGVRHAFISPGSRSTPLVLALSDQKKIKTYNIIDERSSGYIGLGLSKLSKNPVLIITTSGTAVTNLFPSIVEAYMSCAPMIILTADRPKKLVNTGSNQTINQYNIFGHYAKFFDLSNLKNMNENKVSSIALDSYKNAMGFSSKNKGPVHLNIPFDSPLYMDKRAQIKLKEPLFSANDLQDKKKTMKMKFPNLDNFLKPLIILTDTKDKKVILLAEKYNIPIFMECRGLRYIKKSKNIISGYEFILKNKSLKPDIILRFGNKPISNVMNQFIDKNNKIVYLIKENEVLNDDAKHIIPCDIDTLTNEFNNKKPKFNIAWLKSIIEDDIRIKNYFNLFFKSSKHHEGYIIHKIISSLPKKSNLMIGNSSPIRDLDKFTFNDSLGVNIFSNRGVSGIDGLISTSIGISMNNKKNNFLILGDISFFYDVSSLINHASIASNLTIFILNNHGGQIFNRLEGLKNEKKYKQHWLTPINLNIKDLAEAFKCGYFKISSKTYKNINNIIIKSQKVKGIKLIEIDINADKSLKINDKIDQEIAKIL